MSNALNVELGAVDVSIDGVDVGHTEGGAEVTYAPSVKEVMVDKYGETPVDVRTLGERWTAKIRFAEFTIANLKKAMPQLQFAGAANARATVGRNAGYRGTDSAVELVLHPSNLGTRKHDVVFYKAYPISTVTLPHQNGEDKIVEVEFLALVDENRANGNYLGMVGDSTA